MIAEPELSWAVLLTAKQTAAKLGISLSLVYALVKDGRTSYRPRCCASIPGAVA